LRTGHIVNSKEAMVQKTLEILRHENANHRPVLPFLIDDSVKAIIGLFER